MKPIDYINSLFAELPPDDFIMQFTTASAVTFIENWEKYKLEQEALQRRKEISVELITTVVCNYFKIPVTNIGSCRRFRETIVMPRQWVHYFCKKYLKLSLAEIGYRVNNCDHATVMHSCKTILALIDSDKQFQRYSFDLESALRRATVSNLPTNTAKEVEFEMKKPVPPPPPRIVSTEDNVTNYGIGIAIPRGSQFTKYVQI